MPITDWDDERNATRYDEYARQYQLYRETSRHLVELVNVDRAHLVVDLACGTGVMTRAILDRQPAAARVIGLDASSAMIGIARRNVADRRVSWVCAPAADLHRTVSHADAVLCNAAFWDFDRPIVLPAIAAALNRGGQFGFNLTSPFVTLPSRPDSAASESPTLADYARAIAAVEYGLRLSAAPGARAPQVTPDEVTAQLGAHGLLVEDVQILERAHHPDEGLAWLSVPVFANEILPGLPHPLQLDVLEKAYARWDKMSGPRSRWMAFVARKM